MNLEALMVDTKSAWVEFPEAAGFEVQVNNLSRKEIVNLRKRCITTKFNRKTRTMEEDLNEEKFVREFTKATVVGWKGFQLKYLEDLLLVDLGDNDPESELEYNQENAEMLVNNSTEFDNWLNEVVFDLANFRGRSEGGVVAKTGRVAKQSTE
tara:strand:- start:307 stop:765 length:459 start_codon:yes stop_codon:yes gene_type:complete